MEIKEIIENKFGLKVTDVVVLGQGLDSVAYLVNGEYVFKQSKHEESRMNMKKEIKVLNYLKGKLSLQIPVIEFYDEEYSVCGYKEIKGKKLTKDMYFSMSKDEQDRLAQKIALFLKELHSLDLPDIEDLELDVVDDYRSDYESLKGTIYSTIPDKIKEYLDNLFRRILSDERITRYVKALCHNDLSCNHIIMRNNEVVGIIDFGDVAVTDRDKDFVYLLEDSTEELGRDFGLKVLDYYNHPDMESAVMKADLNEEYYPIEQILGGQAKELDDMYNEGLSKLMNM